MADDSTTTPLATRKAARAWKKQMTCRQSPMELFVGWCVIMVASKLSLQKDLL